MSGGARAPPLIPIILANFPHLVNADHNLCVGIFPTPLFAARRSSRLKVNIVFKEIKNLSSSGMGVLLSPLLRVPPKTIPPLRGPTVLGGTFGARAQGRPKTAPPRRRHVMPLAMRPLRDQMAHCRRTLRLPSALTRSPRRSRGLTPCERLVSGSTSNEITSCLRTSRSEFSLFRLRKRAIVLGDARTNAYSLTPIFG